MKKSFLMLLVILMFITILASCLGEYPDIITQPLRDSEGLEFKLNADQKSYSVVGIGTCKDTDIVIPDTHEGLPITIIGENAFCGCNSLLSVSMGDFVMSIDDYAFAGCELLISVSMGDSVRYIGDCAFSKCYSLNRVIMGDSVTSIRDNAFNYCTSLISIVIPNSVTRIGFGAFSGCELLTSVVIPNSVTSIGEAAFFGCSSLTSVVIPDSVTSISYGAFCDCESLTIYCEAKSKPSGWHDKWNMLWVNSNEIVPVVWGYTGK